jgi:NAD(P)-dependent dehydrogenase (short-subunit alcohol dehydrogenase family)
MINENDTVARNAAGKESDMKSLADKVAVVTGASRGAGRAIAAVLGSEGATVYVTGRTVRGGESSAERTETIHETAELVTARGGVGIAVRCDHTVEEDIRALFAQIEAEQGRLDLLVNNAWGGYEHYGTPQEFDAPFWELPMWRWDKMFTAGLRSHLVTTRLALPMMFKAGKGLILMTATRMDPDKPTGSVFYETVKIAKKRMVESMGVRLKEEGHSDIAVLAVAPGWMRTEGVLEHFGVTEEQWQTVLDLATTESPEYLGRAIAALAADEKVAEKSGRLWEVGELSPIYGFTDIDGRVVPPFRWA